MLKKKTPISLTVLIKQSKNPCNVLHLDKNNEDVSKEKIKNTEKWGEDKKMLIERKENTMQILLIMKY